MRKVLLLLVTSLILFVYKQYINIAILFPLIIIIWTYVALFFSLQFFRSDHHPVRSLIFYLLSVIPLILTFSSIYNYYGIIGIDNKLSHPSFLETTYFSVVTWTSLGYGDFKPSGENPTMIWAMIEVLLGYLYMGLLISKLVTFMHSLERS
ncbi:MAG: ion channel [Sedimenticola sp.]